MKNFTKLILCLVVLTTSTQIIAQSYDSDKIYRKTSENINSDIHTLYLNYMIHDYDQMILVDANYNQKVVEKWEAQSTIYKVVIDEVNMVLQIEIDKNLSNDKVMSLLRALNPNVIEVVNI